MVHYICSECGKKEPVTTRREKCECGGLWKLDFMPKPFHTDEIDRDVWNIFRYRAFMPLEDDVWESITLGEGMTPVIRFSENIMLKMDYFMPTLSFKDRGAAVLVAHCKSIGVEHVVQDSSGNAGNSVAAYCARAGIGCEIYVPEGTSPKKIDMIKSHGADIHIVHGSRDYCADVCRTKVHEEGKYYANHVYNPFFYEGTKTYIYEVYEQLHRIPENLFIPIGNGTLFIGAVKALEELMQSRLINKMPQIIGIQSENCAPIKQAVDVGSSKLEPVEINPTLAEGIAIGVPMRGKEILESIYKYKIRIITAAEDRILEARAELASKGIYCEHTTAASYAAYHRYCETYGETTDALISMCGAGLKSDY